MSSKQVKHTGPTIHRKILYKQALTIGVFKITDVASCYEDVILGIIPPPHLQAKEILARG